MDDRTSITLAADRSRIRTRLAAVCLCTLFLPRWNHAAETWGGSLAVTSDYFVRGISRSNDGAAAQADLHVATDSGLIGGVFASSVKFDEGDHSNAELSGFIGYAWQPGSAWRAKILASYYGYVWNDSGSQYNYAELGFEAAFDDWLDVDLVYSPDAPRYVSGRGLAGVTAETAEVTARTPWSHRVAATLGAGYSQLGGAGGGGYVYWSAGGVVDLAPWSVSLAYVNTNAEAAALFYSAAAHNRWTATVIWRF
ncbi:MAG TPA: TorF family putative porin [Steroidobacteraceae bacterium]